MYGTLCEHSLHKAETTYSITATGATSYDLPDAMWSLLNVYRNDSGYRYRLARHDDRVKPGTADTGDACTYRVRGNSIVFYPTPASGTYEVEYIPIPGDLSDNDDEIDGVLGWEEYIVVDCAIKVLQKEEADTSDLKGDRERILRRIENQANLVEFTESRVVQYAEPLDSVWRDGSFWPRRGYRGSLR